MIFSHAVLQGDIDVNPASEVKKSRGLPKKERTALTEEQEAIVRANWNKVPFGLFAYFLLYTGLRRGEALALPYSDIDRENGTIRVEKKLNYTYGHRPHMDYLPSNFCVISVPAHMTLVYITLHSFADKNPLTLIIRAIFHLILRWINGYD